MIFVTQLLRHHHWAFQWLGWYITQIKYDTYEEDDDGNDDDVCDEKFKTKFSKLRIEFLQNLYVDHDNEEKTKPNSIFATLI